MNNLEVEYKIYREIGFICSEHGVSNTECFNGFVQLILLGYTVHKSLKMTNIIASSISRSRSAGSGMSFYTLINAIGKNE